MQKSLHFFLFTLKIIHAKYVNATKTQLLASVQCYGQADANFSFINFTEKKTRKVIYQG